MYNEVTCKNAQPVGIQNNTKITNDIDIYPNPSNGLVNVRTSSEIKDGIIEVYNSIGQLLSSERVNGNYKEMDLSELNSGMYVLRILDKAENQMISKKLLMK